MERLEWNNSYSVDVKEIDEQHKIIFNIINKLIDLKNDGINDPDKIFAVLAEMSEYSYDHFRLENNFINQEQYIGRSRHNKEHANYIDKLQVFISDFEKGIQGLFEDILIFLRVWWTQHILQIDRELGAHIVKNNLAFTGMK